MHRLLEDLSAAGASVVVVGESDHVCGFVCLADRLRPEARQAVDELHAAGIQHVIMLTGDNRPTAQAIAQQSGVDEFRAELLPQDKVTVVEELLGRYGIVGMVGDGVNDAPALARSSLGIAMGAMGTAATMETADIALMVDDLSRLPWLVRYSRRVLRIIRQNIVASLAVKAVFVLLTFFGYASLWAAIAADTGMSVLVVFNALRLLRDRQMMGNVKDSFKSEREVTEK
jgi:Cd2+/Zn2+-exporting ATPase